MSDIVEWPSSVDHGPFKAERHESGWWIVTNAKGSEVDESGDGGFTEKSALWIAEAMNDKHAETILALRKEVERLRGHVSEQVTHVETRIQDGIELGATVWRIALEDVVRENRTALATEPVK